MRAEDVAKGSVDQRNHLIIERLLNEITQTGDVSHDTPNYTARGDVAPVVKLDKRLFELKADRILPKHKLLKMFDPSTVKMLLNHSVLLKIRDNQILYKEGEEALKRAYIVLVGRIALKGFLGHSDKLGVVGYVEGGDTLGEEGLFEVASVQRRDTAVAEGDTYVFEIIKDNFEKMRSLLTSSSS